MKEPRTRAQLLEDFEQLKQLHQQYTQAGRTTEADQVLQDMRGLEQELEALITKPTAK